jgi:hypothetical protein
MTPVNDGVRKRVWDKAWDNVWGRLFSRVRDQIQFHTYNNNDDMFRIRSEIIIAIHKKLGL